MFKLLINVSPYIKLFTLPFPLIISSEILEILIEADSSASNVFFKGTDINVSVIFFIFSDAIENDSNDLYILPFFELIASSIVSVIEFKLFKIILTLSIELLILSILS